MISYAVRLRAGSTLAVAVAAVLLGACSARTAPPPAPAARALPADSARMLELAIASARPAYATQEQALAAGAYRGAALASAMPPRTPARPAAERQPAAPAGAQTLPPAREVQARTTPTPDAPPRNPSSPVALLGDETEATVAATATSPAPSPGAVATPPGARAPVASRTGVGGATDPNRSSALPRHADDAGVPVAPAAGVLDGGSPAEPVGAPGLPPRPDEVPEPALAVESRPERSGHTAADAPATGRFVVQIAAFRDLSSAERARADAARLLPWLTIAIDRETDVFRVVAGDWEEEAVARTRLPEIRDRYPTAWVRPGTVP